MELQAPEMSVYLAGPFGLHSFHPIPCKSNSVHGQGKREGE